MSDPAPLPPIPADAPQPGSVWFHFKHGQLYRVLRLVRHSETQEVLVEYTAFICERNAQEGQVLAWVRPVSMWNEITAGGMPRFTYAGWTAPT